MVMEEELTCCVCLELYEEPVLLPCSHNLCKKCLRSLLNWTPRHDHHFSCPKCRKPVRVNPWEGISSLPQNRVLANIVALYKEESESLNKSRCMKHNGKSMGGLYCRSCSKYICEQCLKETHNGFGHVVKEIGDFVQEEQDKVMESIQDLKMLMDREKKQKERLQQLLKDIESQQSGQLVTAEKQVQQLTQAILVKQQQFQARISREARQSRQPLDIELDKASTSLSQAQQLMDSYQEIQNKKSKEQQLKNLARLNVSLTSFLTFKGSGLNSTAASADTSLKQYEISNMKELMQAVSNMSWQPVPEESSETSATPHATTEAVNGAKQGHSSPGAEKIQGACSSLPNLHNLSMDSKLFDGHSLGGTSNSSSHSDPHSDTQSTSSSIFSLGKPMKFDFTYKGTAMPGALCRPASKKARAVRRFCSMPGTDTASLSSKASVTVGTATATTARATAEWYQPDRERRPPRSPKHVCK